ncbi:MAG: NAD(P)/FAD-dependent oxidoreductase [Planctomycetes bacterium]|nr:NAD(P)/FAD-dependent oxidoreductase [Planctomycetota bacterium]
MNRPDYDVVILGAGLAGSLLVRQLRLTRPDLSVLCLERSTGTSYKVGEATVELFSNYMVRKLGLTTYLYEHHLPKNGLRFFFDNEQKNAPIERMSEIGSYGLPFHPSFQLDRSTLERELRDGGRRLGAELIEGAKVTGVELGEPHHHVTFCEGENGSERRVSAGYVVDATGRASLLAKQLDLRVKVDSHRCLASWARLGNVVDLDGPQIDQAWRDRVHNTSRRLSTVHFMHRGYWVWLIPLKGGVTSIGIVGDTRHVERSVLTKDGLREFLCRQRACRDLIGDAEWLDFGGYGQLAYGTKQWFGDRWAVVGESAAFSDPFYSPGSDFITLANDYTADLIARRHDGEDIAERQRLYEGYLQFRYQANLPLYHEQYDLFGSYDLLSIKWNFDIANYYCLWVNSYMVDQHLSVEDLRHELRQAGFVTKTLERFGRLFRDCERVVTQRGDYFQHNLGELAEGLGDVSFTKDVGKMDRKQAEAWSLDTFAKARSRCFEMLGRPVDQDEKLGFVDFVNGRALATTSGG